MTNHIQSMTAPPEETGNRTVRIAPATPGLVLMTVGFILLADKFHWLEVESLWKLWPVALIIVGFVELAKWWRIQR